MKAKVLREQPQDDHTRPFRAATAPPVAGVEDVHEANATSVLDSERTATIMSDVPRIPRAPRPTPVSSTEELPVSSLLPSALSSEPPAPSPAPSVAEPSEPADVGDVDLMERAETVARRREEIFREEAEIRRGLEAKRDDLRAQLRKVEDMLAKLTKSSDKPAEDRYGAVPELIRTILRLHPGGLTAVQIGDVAREQGRPLSSGELHSTLSRMVKTGDLKVAGKPRSRVYSFAN